MRRFTRTIQHLITGSLASHRVARANAAAASVTLEAQREDREDVGAHLAAHRATRAQAATRALSATTTGHVDRDTGQDAVQNDSQGDSQGPMRVPSPRVGTAVEVDPERHAATAAVVAEAVASAWEGAR